MSEEYSRAEGEELDILLEMNQQLREEVRAHGKRKSRRYLGSLTVLGVLLGYLFTTSGDARVLVLVPFVLAFLYLSHISSMNYVVQLAALLALIEAKINYLGAEYEYYHGGFNISANPRFQDLDVTLAASRHDQPTVVSTIRRQLQAFALDQQIADTASTDVLQRTVRSRVRDGMHILAISSYLGAAIFGGAILSTTGLPELGLVGIPAAIVTLGILGLQLGLLVYIISAWSAYQHHRTVLAAGVENAVDKDDLEQGLRTRERTIGAE